MKQTSQVKLIFGVQIITAKRLSFNAKLEA